MTVTPLAQYPKDGQLNTRTCASCSGGPGWTLVQRRIRTILAPTSTFNPQSNSQVVRLAGLTLAAIAYFVLAIVAVHVLRPGDNAISQPTSDYAVGPYGWVMTSAFFSMGVATWSLLFGLARSLPPAARSRLGLLLLAVWGTGVLVAMFFPTDLDGAPVTLAGTIHRLNGFIIFFSLTVSVFLISRRLKYAAAWQPIYRPALMLSLLLLVEFVATGAAIGSDSGLGGLAQRLDLATGATWYCLMAGRLRTVASPAR
jgi:hypothetical protein